MIAGFAGWWPLVHSATVCILTLEIGMEFAQGVSMLGQHMAA